MGRVLDGPTWSQGIKRPVFPKLHGSILTDVLIIGGGMAGINIAYEVLKTNKKVVVIEKDHLGSGATEYTSAFLTHVIDTALTDLQSMFGTKTARLVWEAHKSAIVRYATIIKKEKIDCEFKRCSYHLYACKKEDIADLKSEMELAKKFGFPAQYRNNDDKYPNHGYLEVKEQGKFHPLKYLYSLAQICQQRGIQIYEQTEALDIKKGEIVSVKTNRGTIKSRHVIIATYAPFKEPTTYKIRKGMYQDHLYELRIPKNVLPEAIFADNENPYHYWRVDDMGLYDRLIIGGETHRTEIPMDDETNFSDLKKDIRRLFGDIPHKLIRRWTGPLLEPSDGLAFIGKFMDQDNIYVATAFSGNGMTYSGIASMIITDLILDKKNKYAEVFAADRDLKFDALLQKGKDYTGTLIGGAVKNIVHNH
jgi:glycine/D-amino acid oxidase-like deaminating enzyme